MGYTFSSTRHSGHIKKHIVTCPNISQSWP
jgi:hypothetical protein